METVSENFIAYSLNGNLDCNKICGDIQKMINKMIQDKGPLDNYILKITIKQTILGGDELIMKLPSPT
jgi:hypothetical protein